MILIIGGAGQGKLDYVLQKTGYGPAQVARTRRRPGHGPSLPGWRTGRNWTRRRCWRPTRA